VIFAQDSLINFVHYTTTSRAIERAIETRPTDLISQHMQSNFAHTNAKHNVKFVCKTVQLEPHDYLVCLNFILAVGFVTNVFTYESSYCFQRVLAIAILSVCPSVCHTGGSVKNGAS